MDRRKDTLAYTRCLRYHVSASQGSSEMRGLKGRLRERRCGGFVKVKQAFLGDDKF